MFQTRLKQLRESKNLTQKNLAEILNLTQSTIAYYETGQKLPTIDNLLAIANFFSVSTDYLLGINEYTDKYSSNVKPEVIEKDSNNLNKLLNKDYSKLISYFERLDNENQEYIIGKMIELYKEQINYKRYVMNGTKEVSQPVVLDDDISRELESYRKELLAKKGTSPTNDTNKNAR